MANPSLSYTYYFGRFSSRQAELAALPFFPLEGLEGLVILTDYMIFLLSILDVVRISVNSYFPHPTRFSNLPAEYFPLTLDINGFLSLGLKGTLSSDPYMVFIFVFFPFL